MSKFNNYARKLDQMARETFAALVTAKEALTKAEAEKRAYPRSGGLVSGDYAIKSAKAETAYLEAEKQYKAARENAAEKVDSLRRMRAELQREIDDNYSVNPAALDTNSMELLKSGIMKAGDYSRMYDAAKNADNITMLRMIGKYAKEAAELEIQNGGKYSEDVRILHGVAHAAQQSGGGDTLAAFDYLTDAFTRCTRNTAMIPRWDELTADKVENF